MGAFSSTLSAFCSGTAGLAELLKVLREEASQNRSSLSANAALVDRVWRAGQVDDAVYQVLRDTITSFDAERAPSSARQPDAARRHQASEPRLGEETQLNLQTLLRPAAPERPQRGAAPDSLPPISAASGRSTASNASWPDWPPLEVTIGRALKERFILEAQIGRGGMGTVFKARDLRKEEAQDREPFVAVKVLNENFRKHPESFKALQREAKKSQSLAHPNVASVYDFDRDGATVFLVMELLEGNSLQALIETRAGRGLPHAEVLRIVRSAGAALAHAHAKGVIHSDFKPANVIRTYDGVVKVLDFGIARAFAPTTDRPSQTTQFDVSALRALTPAYASPEMLHGEPADPRDDVFALACVTYELLAGRHPFGYGRASQRDSRRLVPIENLQRKTWRALQRALAFSRDERTASVEEFLRDVEPSRSRAPVFGAVAGVALAIAAAATIYVTSRRDEPRDENVVPVPQLAERAPANASSAPAATPVAEPPQRAATQASVASSPAPEVSAQAPMPASTPSQQANAAAVPATDTPKPAPVDKPGATERSRQATATREFSIVQLKERVTSLARADDVPGALETFQVLQARLPAEEDPVIHEAAESIAQAYARLADRAVTAGDYASAASLLTRANEMTPNSPAYVSRGEEVERIARVANALEHGSNLGIDALREALARIRQSEGSQFYTVRARLAGILAERIRGQQPDAAAAADLIGLAQELFAGVPEIDALSSPPSSQ